MKINEHQIILIKITKIMALIYFIVGLVFLLLTNPLLAAMNNIHALLPPSLGLLPTAQPPDHFWIIIVFSMMMMLVFSCRQISLNPFDISWHQILILSKGISTMGFALFFFFHFPCISYLIGFFTDFPLLLLSVYIMKQFSAGKSAHAY